MRFAEFNISEDQNEIGGYQLPATISSPDEITNLQKVLASFQFLQPMQVTGKLDAATTAAIKQAQGLASMPETGVPDAEFIKNVNTVLLATPEIGGIMNHISNLIHTSLFSDGDATVMLNNPNNGSRGEGSMMTPPPNKPPYKQSTNQFNPTNDLPKYSFGMDNTTPKSEIDNTTPKSEIDKFRTDNTTTEVTPKKSYNGKLEPGFIEKVEAIAGRLGIDPNILMKIMQHETGGTFDPKATNPDGHHVGLIQFETNKTAPGLGTNKQKLLNMSQLQQLDYVLKYYEQVGVEPGMDSAEIYMLTFLPWTKGRPDSTVIGQASGGGMLGHTGFSKKNLWAANPPFRKWAQSKGQDYYTKGDVIDYYRHYKPT